MIQLQRKSAYFELTPSMIMEPLVAATQDSPLTLTTANVKSDCLHLYVFSSEFKFDSIDIKCSQSERSHKFSATITLPSGFVTVPVFEDAQSINPSFSEKCHMKRLSNTSPTFLMKITDYNACGVKLQRTNEGREWFSVSIRFPYIGGLRTSDDEYVLLMCKPDERVIVMNQVLEMKSNKPVKPKKVFTNEPQTFEAQLSMYAKPDGMDNFIREVPIKGKIVVGEEVQLKAVVKGGSVWKYAKLQDIVIQRISEKRDGKQNDQTPSAAHLVLDDGCRNPVFTAIAPLQPQRDPNDPLTVRFNFKAFMFQEMSDEDSIRVTAKIVACQQENDCNPNMCMDNNQHGFGRKRREVDEFNNKNNTTTIYSNFDARVVLPSYFT
ncbi:uncharacterized protein B4U79_09858, partial [Dinothrombium tinctorium]